MSATGVARRGGGRREEQALSRPEGAYQLGMRQVLQQQNGLAWSVRQDVEEEGRKKDGLVQTERK